MTSIGNIPNTFCTNRRGGSTATCTSVASGLKLEAQNYLIRRQREPADVYTERLSRVFDENYIGSIVDWYAATLFRTEPVLTFEGKNDAAKQFYLGHWSTTWIEREPTSAI